MALLPILCFPNPKLRTIAKPVAAMTPAIEQLIKDMFETMYDTKGIGLAATQVDQHIQLIVMDLSEEQNQPQVFINPTVTPLTQEKLAHEEGCLSVPTLYDMVERPSKVLIDYTTPEWTQASVTAEELLAVCIQHEMDHLNGVLFVDHLSALKRQRIRDKLVKMEKARARAPKHESAKSESAKTAN